MSQQSTPPPSGRRQLQLRRTPLGSTTPPQVHDSIPAGATPVDTDSIQRRLFGPVSSQNPDNAGPIQPGTPESSQNTYRGGRRGVYRKKRVTRHKRKTHQKRKSYRKRK